ncbi:MAG: hypothetical protein SGARI_000015 [Bacillariaceae sp.]
MKRKQEQQPKLKLYYFDIKGKGEPIRLLCYYAGLELEDHRFATRDEFLAMREGTRLTFSQVPMLEVDGKHTLVQSGKLANLYPSSDDPVQAAKVDAIMDQESDAFSGTTVLTYQTRFGLEMTPEETEKSFDNISEEVLPHHLKNIEKLLIASPTGWLAATDEPSPADFMWWVKLSLISEKKEIKLNLEPFPKIQAFMTKFGSLESIQEYYAEKDDVGATGVAGTV